MTTIEDRVADLERRVQRLEGGPVPVSPPPIPADTDATQPLTDWLAGLAPGTVADFQDRPYRVDRSLILAGLSQLTIRNARFDVSSPSTELDRSGRSIRRHVWLRRCDRIRFENLTVTGGNTTSDAGDPVGEDGQAAYLSNREWEHGIAVEDCTNIVIDGLRVDAVRGDGAYMRRSQGVTITNFDISRNGRQGIAVVSGNDYKILHGRIRNSRRSGIDLEPNTNADVIGEGHDVWAGDPGVEVGHVTIKSRLLPFTAGGPGVVKHVHIHHINVEAGGVPALSLVPHGGGRRDDWLVEHWNNLAPVGSPAQPLRLGNADRIAVRDFNVECRANRSMTGVLLRNTGKVTLERVTFPGAAYLTVIDAPAINHELTVIDCIPEA